MFYHQGQEASLGVRRPDGFAQTEYIQSDGQGLHSKVKEKHGGE